MEDNIATKQPKAFIIVGHSNWGKSRTLRQLTGSRRRAWIEINDIWIFVSQISNDYVHSPKPN